MSTRNPFSAPYNWCDSQCRRCALSDTCPVSQHHARRRWRHEARGEDPDAPHTVLEDVMADLREAHSLLEQIASEQLEPIPPPEPRPLSLGKKQLERAALQLARCVVRLDASGELTMAGGSECLQLCVQLAGKSARVTSYIGGPDHGVWDCDGVPNLLLLELTAARLRQTLRPLPDAETHAALDEVERLLAPLLASVGPAARAELAWLVRAGRAPSPFLIAAPEGEALATL